MLAVLAVFLPLALLAQRTGNSSYYDYKRFYFGLALGINYADSRAELGTFPILKQVTPTQFDTLYNVRTEGTGGVNIALTGVVRLTDNLDLRLILPEVSLQQRNYYFLFNSGTQLRKIESTYLATSLMLKYKSDVYHDYRVYVATGPRYGINFLSDERVANDPELLKIVRRDFGWTFAVGMDFYGTKLKLSPELSYTFGFSNVYVPRNEDVPGAIRNIYTNAFALTIYFE